MTRNEFEQAQQEIFADLDRARPSTRAPITLTARDYKVAIWISLLSLPLLPAVASIAYLSPIGTSPWSIAVSGTGMGVIGAIVLLCSVGNPLFKLSEKIDDKIRRFKGGSILSLEQAQDMSQWATQYPQLSETFERWIAKIDVNSLNETHYLLASSSVKKLLSLDSNHQAQLARDQELEAISRALNKHGLVDRGVSLGQVNKLSTGTAVPTHPSKRRGL